MSRAGRGGLLAFGILLFCVGVAGAALRIGLLERAGDVRLSADWALTDFYSAAFAPARAVLAGGTPYTNDSTYPPYAPLHLLLHLPFALPTAEAAGVAYFLFTAALTLPLAWLALRLAGLEPVPHRVLVVAGLVLLSRPGHWTLLLGQVSILLTVATYAAIRAPVTGALAGGGAVAVALLKPTFGVPLALLLWAWGRGRQALAGLLLAGVVNLPVLLLFAERQGGWASLFSAAVGGYRSWQDIPDVDPSTSNTRTDLTSLVSRFLGHPLADPLQVLLAAGVLAAAALVLHRLRGRDDPQGRAVGIGVLTLAISLVGFHRGYDLVLLAAPCLVAARSPGALTQVGSRMRLVLLALFAAPALNWVATESVLEAWRPDRPMWLLITSANALCLVALLLAYLWMGLRLRDRRNPPA